MESPRGLGCPHTCLVLPKDIICQHPVATKELTSVASGLSPHATLSLPPCPTVS